MIEEYEDQLLDTAGANREAVIALADRARFSIDLFSRDLDARVFDNTAFERCIFELARTYRNADIRILVTDSSPAVSRGHCLIRLAQRLTSSVHIHNPAKQHSGELATFMVVDGTALLHRPRTTSTSYDATLNLYAPKRAGELSDYFNEMWARSTPDSQVRRLYI